MTYRELFYKATRLIEHHQITLGEYEEMTKPLDREVEQEPCDDTISRQAVLDLPRIKTHNEWGNVIKESVYVEDVRRLPSVTSQPKTGHWIEEFNDLEGEVRFTCSSCGKYQLFGTDYCYNCGAKMIEPQERSDKK